MPNPPFYESKLKIKRANRHINNLNNEIRTFAKTSPYKVVIEADIDPSQHNWTIRVREDGSGWFACIIGDAIHNLRSSLDLLAGELVRLNGGNTSNVLFPFASKGDDLDLMIKKRNIDRASTEVVDIIRSLKPYTGGNETLRAIHDFDIMDKHKLLIPVAQLADIPNVSVHGVTFKDCKISPLKDGMVVISAPASDKYKLGKKFKITFDVLFGDGQPFEGEPVIPTLKQLSELVDGIVDTFSMLYSGT